MVFRNTLIAVYVLGADVDRTTAAEAVDNYLNRGWQLKIPCQTMTKLTATLELLEVLAGERFKGHFTAYFASVPGALPAPKCHNCGKYSNIRRKGKMTEKFLISCVHCGRDFHVVPLQQGGEQFFVSEPVNGES